MFQSVQRCRAIAAIAVMCFHLALAIAAPKYFGITHVDRILRFGHAGVEFFFVLSGFIIAYAHWSDFGKPSRALRYVKRRILRIYPTYWIVFAIVYLVALVTLGSNIEVRPQQLGTTLALLPQAALGSPSGTKASILIVAWSLQYEVMFYVLVGLFILNRRLGTVVAVLLLANIVSNQVTGVAFGPPYLRNSFPLLFGLGALTANIIRRGARLPYPGWITIAGTLGFLVCAIWDDVSGVRLSAFYGLSSALVLVGVVSLEVNRRRPIQPGVITRIGDASYVLYLIHYPLISLICKAVLRAHLDDWFGAMVAVVLAITVCIGGALAFVKFVERPLRAALSRWALLTPSISRETDPYAGSWQKASVSSL